RTPGRVAVQRPPGGGQLLAELVRHGRGRTPGGCGRVLRAHEGRRPDSRAADGVPGPLTRASLTETAGRPFGRPAVAVRGRAPSTFPRGRPGRGPLVARPFPPAYQGRRLSSPQARAVSAPRSGGVPKDPEPDPVRPQTLPAGRRVSDSATEMP